ncbi:hypothetical protein POF50_007565 [Streptomyces sp. SL13]|uniref:Uncharacterized protein n=1 Tax=Streptantibioticus silvisoli TaxID=2705255 RepID=A0AA90H751_9ACTN|nr:hypothetical protein [Streptantibioticus silvisoli]MDI5962571.1 hypothetical protein [Streptantibioticus silvisoli]MDI5969202.1 hypothetical protein [Streptantibioticus silvisoli]
MTPTVEPLPPPAQVRLARAQAAIRALTERGGLTPGQRLELAEWQREWVRAWRETVSVAA